MKKPKFLKNYYKIQAGLTIAMMIFGLFLPAGVLNAESEAPPDDSSTASETTTEAVIETGDAGGVVNVENNININTTEINSDGQDTIDGQADDGTGADNSQDDSPEEEEAEIAFSESSTEQSAEDSQDGLIRQSDQDSESDSSLIQTDGETDCSDCEEAEDEDESEEDSQEFILEINSDNSAQATTTVSGDVNTGKNSIVGDSADEEIEEPESVDNNEDDNESGEVTSSVGDYLIRTGRASLISNIFNIINLNLTGTNIMSRAYNLIGNILDDIDVSGFSLDELAEKVRQDEGYKDLYEEQTEKTLEDISINNKNDADVINEIELKAESGENEIIGDGVAVIETGDVVVGSNLLNIVNTNITGSNWTLTIINIVGSWDGNLILPPIDNVLQDSDSTLLDPCSSNCHSAGDLNGDYKLIVENDNQAAVVNEVEVVADSGNNEAIGQDSISIETGQALSLNQVLNMVNTNIFGSNWVFGMINVTDGWDGTIWGVPDDNFSVNEVGRNVIFTYGDVWESYFKPAQQESEESGDDLGNGDLEDNNEAESEVNVEEESDSSKTVNISNDNQATVVNKVKIYGSSGSNRILGQSGNATIRTGDVYALSNMLNFVNTNITGDRWTMAIVNVVGSWDGDIGFGQPDLSLIEIAIPDPDPPKPGGKINYILTFTNKGDAPAHEVSLKAKFNPELVTVTETDGGEVTGNEIIWLVDEIGVGEVITKHYQVYIDPEKIDAANKEGEVFILNHAEVASAEPDRNSADNSASTDVRIGGLGSKFSGVGMPVNIALNNNIGFKANEENSDPFANPVADNSLLIRKSNNTQGLIRQGQMVTYVLDIENTKDESIYDVYVFDQLFDPSGGVVSDLYWQLGEVYPHEKIKIDYTISFSESAPFGTYKNQAWADGFSADGQYLVFPTKNNLVVIREPISPEQISIDFTYKGEEENVLTETANDTVVITNNGQTGLPQGKLLVSFDKAILKINNDSSGGVNVLVPSVGAGDSVEISLSINGLRESERSQINLSYLVDDQPVFDMTTFKRIVEPKQIEEPIGTYKGEQRRQESQQALQELNSLTSRVLGVSEAFAGWGPEQDELAGGELNRWLGDDKGVLIAWILLIFMIIWLSWWNKRLNELQVSKRK